MWTSYKLQTEGDRTQGTILAVGPGKDGTEHHLRVEVRFDDGKVASFEQEFPAEIELRTPTYRDRPAPLNYDAGLDHLSRGPSRGDLGPPTMLPVAFAAGDPIPVRYEPKHRRKIIVDWSAVRLDVITAWKATPDGVEWTRLYERGA